MKQIIDLAVLAREAAGAAGSVILDVRRRPVFEAAADQIPGSTWRDPAEARQWLHELDPSTASTAMKSVRASPWR
jgi:hypothetical protein